MYVFRMLTDLLFICAASHLASISTGNGNPVWRYIFTAAGLPNPAAVFPNPGAFHTAEIPQVFGTYKRDTATPEQVQLSKIMQKSWADFAKSPSTGPGWLPFATNSQQNFMSNGNASTVPNSYTDYSCGPYNGKALEAFSIAGSL